MSFLLFHHYFSLENGNSATFSYLLTTFVQRCFAPSFIDIYLLVLDKKGHEKFTDCNLKQIDPDDRKSFRSGELKRLFKF